MMKPKYLLFSAALLAMTQAVALTPVKKQISKVAARNKVAAAANAARANVSAASVASAPIDKDVPAYRIVGKDSTCQIFVYSPAADQGLHLAYLTDDDRWVDVGQLCASDYGPWGSEKKMYRPFVMKANDGTWRALWSVNTRSPQFAVAYSEDLVTWRPQDYPIMKEKGIKDVAAYQMDDGSFDIYLKTAKGKRYVHADKDFRIFEEDSLEATADDILWQRDTATINGKLMEGNDFEIPAIHLNYIRAWHKALVEENRENSRLLPHNEAELQAYLKEKNVELAAGNEVSAQLQIKAQKSHRISDKLIGIFFEDISRAADGGLCAELLQNGDFEYNGERKGWNAITAWQGLNLQAGSSSATSSGNSASVVSSENGVSQNNPHYAILSETPIYNIGWEGITVKRAAYDVSLYARCMDGKKKQLTVALVDAENQIVAQAKLKVQGGEWNEYKTQLVISDKYKGELDKDIRFAVIPKGKDRVAVDMLSLMPQDTYKGHGLRKDLAEVIADLKPRFVRFPGGCMLHGQGLENIYHWKESVGPLKDRKPAKNIWNYHQTRKLGFYEYFQWCEDMGAEPLPVLAAGVPCQNSQPNAQGICGQQGGIPMADMPQYVQDVIDLVEWANGDPATSKWAKMRADAGHPAPFNLKMVGIGNEDLISTDFEQRYLMICKALKEKHPEIEVVGTVGPFLYPSSDYIEGWKIAKENKKWIDAVDEHYYEKPGWFINHQDYYDNYDRKAPKVYLGEYAANGNNELDRALAEGIHLCNVERNGDVVEMTSYAPLLCKNGYSNWNPDMIYFDNSEKIRLTESYKMQKMFGQHAGDIYIASELNLPVALKRYVGTSVVKDSKTGKTWLKVVNALPRTLKLQVNGLGSKAVEVKARSSQVFEL
ncbi:alpha-L-arabinofuranosidase C-terminal domain-containing protein [Segatella copri]|uniref:alpha-L-arabinofuranosidase C-terminal domain-containing protein n=1 Tax=Segatella copri TaxID=165179 RepID=UPI002114E750|nr:alpha-L-arabinofuranosidase C-terminal domain-containing protein [Segatella copri]WOZ86071.1 alpha-L-arabinofuranosidase C-terminal domain-containing protein [Segatella copri]